MLRPVVLSVVTLAIVATTAEAQKQSFAGFTAGATLSNLSGSGASGSSSRWGFTGGLTAGMRATNWSVTAIEVTYTQRGADGIRMDYIDIPLMVGGVARLGSGDLRSRFYGGIQVGFKVSCSAATGGIAGAACTDAKGTVFGLPFGVQIGQYKTGGRMIALDIRYMLGLGNAFSILNAYHTGWTFKIIVGGAK
jgi:hypothetical protein